MESLRGVCHSVEGREYSAYKARDNILSHPRKDTIFNLNSLSSDQDAPALLHNDSGEKTQSSVCKHPNPSQTTKKGRRSSLCYDFDLKAV
jgi:hypothetical protein